MTFFNKGSLTTDTSFLAHIVLEGKPLAAKLKKTKSGRLYNSRKIYCCTIQWKIKIQYRDEPYDGAVKVDYYFGFPIPPSWTKKKRELAKEGGMRHIAKPDCDNLEKLYNDCIKKIIIVDDNQICDTHSIKEYTENPRTEILISYA